MVSGWLRYKIRLLENNFYHVFIIEVVFFLNNITLNFLLMFVLIVAIALYLFWYIFIDIKLITYS